MANSKPSRRWWVVVGAAAMALSVGVAAVVVLRDLVETRFSWPPIAPRVELVNRPPWMYQALAEEIIDTARPVGIHSVFDRQLLIQTAQDLSANPWIKQVRQVRRAYVHWPGDTLEVDCDYRVPTALVAWQGYYWLVDGDGYKLPEQYPQRQLQRALYDGHGKLMLRVIQGVTHPPVASGKQWPGDELAAGLELVKLLAGRPFAEDIPAVDVSNFAGRHDAQAAQLVLLTRYGTQIRWGRPPSAKDFFIEVPTAQKLQYLTDIFDQIHRADGGQPWIDIRFDQVTYPSPQQASAKVEQSGADSATASAN